MWRNMPEDVPSQDVPSLPLIGGKTPICDDWEDDEVKGLRYSTTIEQWERRAKYPDTKREHERCYGKEPHWLLVWWDDLRRRRRLDFYAFCVCCIVMAFCLFFIRFA